MRRNAWKDFAKRQISKVEQLYKVSAPCLDNNQFKKKEELQTVGAFVKGLLSNPLEMLVHVTQWKTTHCLVGTQNWHEQSTNGQELVRDGWRVRFPTFTARVTADSTLMCEMHSQHWRVGLLQDSDLAGDLEDSTSTSGRILCIFRSRTCGRISWMCKKQTSTVRLNLILFLHMQHDACTVYPLLISGIWLLKYCILLYINPEHRGNLYRDTPPEKHSNARTKRTV